MSNHLIPPAQLWIGAPPFLLHKTVTYLQQLFCKTGCGSCSTCSNIAHQQFYATVWLTPDKQYTIDQLDIVFKTISFALDKGERFFFIIQHADFLTSLCANALLKSLEEPPAGYHFILLAHNQERIIPTIRSRCHIHQFTTPDNLEDIPFLKHLSAQSPGDANLFLQDFEKVKPTERTSIEWLDNLYATWATTLKNAYTHHDITMQKKSILALSILKQAYKQPPMPGSAKIFWKNIYLLMQKIIQ